MMIGLIEGRDNFYTDSNQASALKRIIYYLMDLFKDYPVIKYKNQFIPDHTNK